MNKNPELIKFKKLFSAGTTIFKEGSKGNELYVLISGELEVQKKGKTIAIISEPGIFIGELAAILKLPRTADLIAKKDSEVIVIHSDNFKKVISNSPDIATKLIILLAKRLKATTDSLTEMLNNVNPKKDSKSSIQSSHIRITKKQLINKFPVEDLAKIVRVLVNNKIITKYGRDFEKVQKELAIFNKELSQYEGKYDDEAQKIIFSLVSEYKIDDEFQKKLITDYKLFFTDSSAQIIIVED
jgi:CRP/FNR family cyclic AMP-dependent transcriptional regulator